MDAEILRCAQDDSQALRMTGRIPLTSAHGTSSLHMSTGDKRTLALDGAKGLEHMMEQQKHARPVQPVTTRRFRHTVGLAARSGTTLMNCSTNRAAFDRSRGIA